MRNHRNRRKKIKGIFLWITIDMIGLFFLMILLTAGRLIIEDRQKKLGELLVEYMNDWRAKSTI